MFSGGFGAVCLVAAGQPFDTVRVRQQTRPELFTGPLHCARRTIAEEGVLALWRGAMPALSSSVLENAVAFAINGYLRRVWGLTDDSPFLHHASCGGLGGVVSATAICPAEVVKVRMQYQRSGAGGGVLYRSGADCFAQILRLEGARGAFAGLGPLLCRDIPFNFFFFGSYRSYRSYLADTIPAAQLSMCCGGLAGATAWTFVLPIDAIKSRAQVAAITVAGKVVPPASAAEVVRTLWRAGGVGAFYRGWTATVARAFVANSALFTGIGVAEGWVDALTGDDAGGDRRQMR